MACVVPTRERESEMILPKINIGGATYSASINIDTNVVTLINPRTRRTLRVEVEGLADVRVSNLADVLISKAWSIVE